MANTLFFFGVWLTETPTIACRRDSISLSPSLLGLKRFWSQLYNEDELTHLESFEDLDAGDDPREYDDGLSDKDVRRFGGVSNEKPSTFDCHPRNLGEAEPPQVFFIEEAPYDVILNFLGAGETDLGVEDLVGGVNGLLDDVVEELGVEGLVGGVDGLLDDDAEKLKVGVKDLEGRMDDLLDEVVEKHGVGFEFLVGGVDDLLDGVFEDRETEAGLE